MWYRTGTITLTNNSTTVTGVGTNWIAQQAGWILVSEQDAVLYEVSAVVSSTEITLATPFEGASGSTLSYGIIPTQSLNLDLAGQISELIATFNTTRDAWAGVLDDFSLTAFQLWQAQPGNESGTISQFLDSIKGVQGDTGPQGIQGIQGDTGIQGIQGIQGDTGPQGIQGIQGIQGDTGATGLTGDTGPQGIQGIQGDTGPQGPIGPQGIQGDTGATGAGLVILGNVATVGGLPGSASSGDAYAVGASSPRDVYVWNATDTQWDNIGPLEGPQGDTGPAGADATGDMLVATYDTNADGKVDAADTADSVAWAGVTGKPTTFTPSAHNHTKVDITDFSDGDYATSAQGSNADTAYQSSDLASQAQAETGTNNTTLMTPLRTAQAIAELETGLKAVGIKTAAYTALPSENVLTDTTAGVFTITLPASPVFGTEIAVTDVGGAWDTNNLTVARNGSTIENAAEDLVCDLKNLKVVFLYTGVTWSYTAGTN